jgi:hypothetical protein
VGSLKRETRVYGAAYSHESCSGLSRNNRLMLGGKTSPLGRGAG